MTQRLGTRALFASCVASLLLPATSAIGAPPKDVTVTKMLLGGDDTCFTNPQIGGTESALSLAVPFVEKVGTSVLNMSATVLTQYLDEKVKSEEISVETLTRSTNFYSFAKDERRRWEVRPALNCIVIARGTPGKLDSRAIAKDAARLDPSHSFSEALERLGFRSYPNLYVELSLEQSSDGTAFRPRLRSLLSGATSVRPAADGTINLNLVLTFTSVGEHASFASMPISIHGIRVGARNQLSSLSMDNPWAPMPAVPQAKKIPPAMAKVLTLIPVLPVNVSATFEETGSSNRVLKFLSAAIKNR
jgi:hypothetical protein